ncbi:MAG: hypothetical protein A3E07_01700 [Candidatus Wildermuthbacteria bacterium RIFCSPHIGHO2_12_FULL_45_9]|uniref:Uncharacterized protein n=1 Tax=Candidatus Wildermuthbacteria bacterium RIFCSPHIGHO2_02_FULL_45_25 TaxID=1802450 RepID=A0A1G2R4T6_9BACT|nr:MAG: hypothetical protein A2748_01170 [Candidatus Wildermuthbacteria bacterium RIFCSPHIGHO2_01_FULL_45_20]OHA67865.1 MAG: hypothetical protein A3C04_02935 [Candidatus Wildermuthbacteria bacterium RIFCSPHIGHO2_02_FULL_45_25]OHA70203.1 MAG: hypothetical protein A3E07_01700 [Candidatus Wildermuthbacteria bacterium RIFCSPHIGHO2_12_FULL_45_9]
MRQEELLRIVERWNINPNPEYRGFRCAQCQEYIIKAWHHWLKEGGYKTPVHVCQVCQQNIQEGNEGNDSETKEIERAKFQDNLPSSIFRDISGIVDKWELPDEAVLLPFTCDKCHDQVEQAWHIWTLLDTYLVETHFCKKCGANIKSK